MWYEIELAEVYVHFFSRGYPGPQEKKYARRPRKMQKNAQKCALFWKNVLSNHTFLDFPVIEKQFWSKYRVMVNFLGGPKHNSDHFEHH